MRMPGSRYRPAAALLVSCFFIASCENDTQVLDTLFSNKAAFEEAFQVNSYFSQGGQVKARLTAPYMKRYIGDSPYVEFTRSLHVDFYNPTGTIESKLDAHYARHLEYEQRVLIKDSVVVINMTKGDTLKTDELWWDQNAQEFKTDKPVQIFQQSGYTFGRNGLTAKQDFSEWWILGSSGQRIVEDSIPLP